jgi:hypothetical protein
MFEKIKDLNPNVPLYLPDLGIDRQISIHQNYKGASAVVGMDQFITLLEQKCPDFKKDFKWDIGKNGVFLISLQPSSQSTGANPSEEETIKFNEPEWVKELPTVTSAINSQGDAELKTGNYTEPVTIKGDLELKGEKFAFKELKLDGNLKVNGQKISGTSFSLKGDVEMGAGSEARFKTITSKGSLKLKSGSRVYVKDLVLDKGDIVLGENSHIILN